MLSQTVTRLIAAACDGDSDARNKLYEILYRDLSRIARGHLAHSGSTLDPTAVIHDSFVRMERSLGSGEFPNRKYFLGYASTVMRSVIVDYVRERQAQRRGGSDVHVTLRTRVAGQALIDEDILDINEALSTLARVDQRCHRVVEMRYFGGLTEEEEADVLEVSLPTVKRDWRKAKAFLLDFLRNAS
jgi:RNA polymerase sigma factor (TIGR02999 family)